MLVPLSVAIEVNLWDWTRYQSAVQCGHESVITLEVKNVLLKTTWQQRVLDSSALVKG